MGVVKRAMDEMHEARENADREAYLEGLILAGDVPPHVQGLEGLRRGPPNEELYFTDCAHCASPIPPHELAAALDNGGLCAYCEHIAGKD